MWFTTPLLLNFFINTAWSSSYTTGWFGHIVVTTFQVKVFYLLLLSFFFIWLAYLTNFYFNSSDIYDYFIVSYSFFIWVSFLFYSNNSFTVIFFIEIISTLIMLLIITSLFSSRPYSFILWHFRFCYRDFSSFKCLVECRFRL
jgi:hypothetical protein